MNALKQYLYRLYFWVMVRINSNKVDVSTIRTSQENKPKSTNKPKRANRSRTIKDTLETLDNNFEDLKKSDHKASWSDPKTRKMLREIGPFVPPPDYEIPFRWINKPERARWPGVVFVSTNFSMPKYKIECPVSYMYAIKVQKLPATVLGGKGVKYEVGLCVSGDKMLWVRTYCCIDSAGNVSLLRARNTEIVSLPKTSSKKSNGGGFFARQKWEKQSLYLDEEVREDTTGEEMTKDVIRLCFNYWFMRDKMWNIIIRQGKKRMNFSIDRSETKHYFKDRDRKGLCKDGRLRPIIHFVEGHERNLSGGRIAKVQPHIRGVRQFEWKGYKCNVKAPKFGGATMLDFDVASDQFDENEKIPDSMVESCNVVSLIRRIEDEKQPNVAEWRKRNSAIGA